MKLLITGFPKFDAFPENSTEALIESMKDDFPPQLKPVRSLLAFEIVGFDNADAASQRMTMVASFRQLLRIHAPTVCLFCGQAAERSLVTLETVAINVFKGEIIDPEGPPAYWATLPEQQALIETLRQAEIPAALSYHAGTHLCNHILYTALRHAEKAGNTMRCGFLHLPMTNAQVISGNENRALIPLSMTRRALILAIEHLYRHLAAPPPGNLT